MRRKLKNNEIRKIFKTGNSYAITLPLEIMQEFKWREKQKVVVKKRGKTLVISDWE
ncbi:AbrB/MazE/SpoVT family DNA-binding domain-containing protein [Patescibacteria group bacterium]|nr:AbrB/MazE/SpoVT family DNA-binding domain-containing protein [Patescibacteria group bacterium]